MHEPSGIIFLLGRFSGYGFGHGGVGAIGVLEIILLIPVLTGRL
ncbi:DUF3309 domain-containing protein [Hoeflea alexandrii]|nr:DUF3309 domain-containing protein [Hoeflea alexandrii]MCZ4291733.1 DUF3309 domain-containing protein [Hoeflea alexandrii]